MKYFFKHFIPQILSLLTLNYTFLNLIDVRKIIFKIYELNDLNSLFKNT